ncbi:MAG: sigma-70 family RNA polymerase sigma factor [Oscillospiraceae bacterium]|nr:sigma-70 family RNA polymerase sigma factor [Oscillospiraceae bacterium]
MDSLNVEDIKNMGDKMAETSEIFEVNDKFYDKYNPHVRKIVARILTNANQRSHIEDCVSEVFLQLIERLRQYNETRGSMAAYVTIIARSVALNYAKSNVRHIGELIGDDNIEFLTEPSSFEDELESELGYETLVKSILEKLSEKESALFTMRFILLYQPEEIAKSLKITRNMVDFRISKLKSKIKRFLIKGGIRI